MNHHNRTYLSLKGLSRYSSIGVTALRGYIKAGGLPHYRLPGPKGQTGKVLVRLDQFDKWMEHFYCDPPAEISARADAILKDFKRVSDE